MKPVGLAGSAWSSTATVSVKLATSSWRPSAARCASAIVSNWPPAHTPTVCACSEPVIARTASSASMIPAT